MSFLDVLLGRKQNNQPQALPQKEYAKPIRKPVAFEYAEYAKPMARPMRVMQSMQRPMYGGDMQETGVLQQFRPYSEIEDTTQQDLLQPNYGVGQVTYNSRNLQATADGYLSQQPYARNRNIRF